MTRTLPLAFAALLAGARAQGMSPSNPLVGLMEDAGDDCKNAFDSMYQTEECPDLSAGGDPNEIFTQACSDECQAARQENLDRVEEACKNEDDVIKAIIKFNRATMDVTATCEKDEDEQEFCVPKLDELFAGQDPADSADNEVWCTKCGEVMLDSQRKLLELLDELPEEGALGAIVGQMKAGMADAQVEPTCKADDSATPVTPGSANSALPTVAVVFALVTVVLAFGG